MRTEAPGGEIEIVNCSHSSTAANNKSAQKQRQLFLHDVLNAESAQERESRLLEMSASQCERLAIALAEASLRACLLQHYS